MKGVSRRHVMGRLMGYLMASKVKFLSIILCGAAGVGLIVYAPKVLAKGTNILFAGVLNLMLARMHVPAGTSKEQIMAMLSQHGQGKIASLISQYDIQVGAGIDWTSFGKILIGVIILYLISILLRLAQNFLTTRVVVDAVYKMRKEIENKIDRLPLSYFDRVPRGEIMSRTTNDVDNITGSLQQMLGEFFFSIFQFIGTLSMMIWVSPFLTLVALAVVPFLLAFIVIILRVTQPQFVTQWNKTGQLNSHVEEMFSGHMVIRAYGQQEEAKKRFEKYNEGLYQSSFKASFLSGLMNPTTAFFGNMSFVLVVIVGGLRVISGNLSLGDLQAFSQYSRQVSQPLGQIASMASTLQSALASTSRVFEFLDADEEEEEDQNEPTLEERLGGPLKGHVTFHHVDFSYDPATPLIRDLSLDALPGQTIAIVGPTGAGKTTLVNLLMRFYEVNGGSISIDGVKTTDITRQDLRSHFGMVLQDTWLFDGTIRDNLFYGVHDPDRRTDQRMIEAAKATHVDEFVRRLPQGYDTVLEEDSSELSQGERQLLTICRALLSDPEILILDEATSSVDTRTESKVQNAMNVLRSGRTSFVIAHRLSTIQDADVILVVNHGSIIEQGSHQQLLEANGAYAALYNSQFTKGEEEE
ncbi:putative ABC transporter ATP-binding and permease components [Parascardovia denticolens DSM 10105 = JCM 12538]|nr:putative ABC transporter ATP-binding and permease components [Parascardovia denticolens DSM 10105 = JCM 12538]